MPSDERFLEWTYPVAGIDRQEEFQEQPALTTAVAKNVRAFESLSDRGRGGSRPGISKYLADTVPSGAHLIQHLKVIVDPQGPLTGLSFGPTDTTTNDTSDGGRAVLDDGTTRKLRVGGSGYYTHPEADQTPGSSSDNPISLRQFKKAETNGDATVTLDSEPLENSVLVVAVRLIRNSTENVLDAGMDVQNNGGAGFARIGEGEADDGYLRGHNTDLDTEYVLSAWTKTATASANDQNIRILVDSASGGSCDVYVMEFERVSTGTPDAMRDTIVFDQPTVPPQPDSQVLSLTHSATNQMAMLCSFSTVDGNHIWSQNFADSTELTQFGPSGLFLRVRYKIGITADFDITFSPDTTTPPTTMQSGLVAMGVVFNWSGG